MKRHCPALLFVIVLAVSIMTLAGCASAVKKADPKESLNDSAKKYWRMRVDDKYEDTYRMEDREGLPPFASYLQKAMVIKKFNIINHSIGDMSMEGDRATIDVEFSFMVPAITKPFKQVVKDRWLYREGKWRHIFK